MTRFFGLLLIGGLAITLDPVVAQTSLPTSFVDPLIGTAPNPYTKIGYAFDTGNVFPGAVCPRGMVACSPDTTHCNNIAGGYWYPDDKIQDFSLTHFSGRGVPCLKDIGFLPMVQQPVTPGSDWAQNAATFAHQNETASPGFYKVKLDNGIEVQLTSTERTGLGRFIFPAKSPSNLLIRANGAISVAGQEATGYTQAQIVKSGHPFKLYFVAQFSTPLKSVQTWTDDTISSASNVQGALSGAILSFDTSTNSTIMVRVGISFTSLDNARDNLKTENQGWDFDGVKKSAEALWNNELNRVELDGGTDQEKRVFYTALYHCLMHPNILEDDNGQYLGMDQKVHSAEKGRHQYQNIPAWDEHRSLSPLVAMLYPNEASDVMQSLVNYAQEDASIHPNGGGLPRWEQVNANSGGMVGDGDDTIIASSYAFGATHFETKGALDAMVKGASQPDTSCDGHKVRDGLNDYTTLGYVPEKAAITLEYSTDDFSISQFAKDLGDNAKAASYQARAQNWKNLFDPGTGYIRPRLADGHWQEPFSPSSGKGFVEGTAAQYVWLVNFNYHSLVTLIGGNDKVNERLDHFFTQTNGGLKGDYAYMGNEPCEETPWVYDFTGAPSRTEAVVRRIQTELFTSKPSGIPGNDDAGSLSSWYVFSALGLYPEIPGVAGFAVGSPVFSKATIHLENGKTLEIIGNKASDAACYVQGLKVNGQPCDSSWIPWSQLQNGGQVEFDLGEQPSKWGTDPAKAPPSFDKP